MSAAEVTKRLFVVRAGRQSDHAFVYSAWLGSDRFSRAGQACSSVYQDEQRRLIESILARPSTVVRIACAEDDDDALLGWSVTDESSAKPAIYYVYVKRGVRRHGIASALLASLLPKACEYTHQPVVHGEKVEREGRKQFAPLYPPRGWTFNPYRNHR